MLDAIIRWSLHNRLTVLALAIVLCVVGVLQTARMPVDVFPDLTAPTVTVIAEAHGMAPRELETLVTRPIESALNGAARVRRIRSSTRVGIALIWVEFDWGVDIYRARQVVAERLQLARAELPRRIAPPVLAPITSIMGEILFIALTSKRHSPMALKTTADWQIRRRLLAVPGVAQVLTIGGETKQYQVIVRPERLAAYDLTLDKVLAAVQRSNTNASAGFVVSGGQEHLIHGLGRVRSVRDIEATVVAVKDGEPVLVRQVAHVRVGPALARGSAAQNGKPAVILGIQKQPGANTLALTREVDSVLTSLQKSLPPGMTIARRVFRQADFIEVSIDNLVKALRDGAVLVVLVVLLFLWSVRTTLITIIAIPLSLLAAVLVLASSGATINTMTLGGLAIAIGAIVDDAIIDAENVVRRLRQRAAQPGEEQRAVVAVVLDASREIRSSIVYATAIIVVVFLPLFYLSGVEGRLLKPLGVAYVVALAASLLVALTVTPVLCSLLLPRSKTVQDARESALARWLKRRYLALLDTLLHRFAAVVFVAGAALAAAVVALPFVGQSFLPEFNEGTLTIATVTLPGTSLDESDRLGRMVERLLLFEPEVVSTARRTGRASYGEHAQAVSASEIDVRLKMRARSKAALLAALRRKLAAVPGTNVTIGQPISHRIDHMLSGTRANIAVKIFGPDLRRLRRLASTVEAQIKNVRGVVDLSTEPQVDIPQVTIRFRRGALARHGISVAALARTVEAAFYGREVSRVREGAALFDLVVRYRRGARASIEAIRTASITTPSGAQVKLSSLADVRRARSPNAVRRENGERRVVVMCNVAGRDLHSVVDDIRARIARSVALPAGYHVQYGGQFESAASAYRTLLIVGALAVLGIFVLLYTALRSAGDAALVMVNLPLALVGGVVAIAATSNVMSIASIIGLVALFGIATRNGLMLVTHIHHLVDVEGETDIVVAVKRAAAERLLPIIMTALATALALIPLSLGAGEPGSEIQAPMALVMLWGLLTSTALNMVVVPALYIRLGARARLLARSQAA